jgi:hypothetical protein
MAKQKINLNTHLAAQEVDSDELMLGAEAKHTAPAKAKDDIQIYTLRLYRSKLKILADIKEARKAERAAKGETITEIISIHRFIQDAIDEAIKKEQKRVAKLASKKP